MRAGNNLSVGIPVFNQVATIRASIDAVLAQSTPPFEIVVSENHSTDGTREIVESYRGRVRIVRPPEHCSMAKNWNFCVRACEGQWVGLCSGDDMLLPNYVESLYKAIQKNSETVFVMGGWEVYNETTGQTQPHHLLSIGSVTHYPKTVQMLLRGPKASFAAFCFNREAYNRVGGYDENFNLIQDWILQFDLAKLGDFVKVDELIARYRIALRPNLDERRKSLYLEDRIRYLSSKIWEAQDCGVSPSYIRSSAKSILYDTLRYIRLHGVIIDDQSKTKLREVALVVGASKQWNRWEAGTWVPSEGGWLTKRLKSAARKLITLAR